MTYKRVIPCLLLKNNALIKTIKFKESKYVGDPINAVKIFNEKEVDELIILDIMASKVNAPIQFDLLERIANESFMPLAYGGGIRTFDDIRKIINLGFEKVCINNSLSNYNLIKEACQIIGSQSIIASIDVKRDFFGKHKVYNHVLNKVMNIDPVTLAQDMEKLGVGEIIINSVEYDGIMRGYNLEIIKSICDNVNVPVIAVGGAGSIQDLKKAFDIGASAVSAGSMFVFKGIHRAVLINYPSKDELKYLNN